MSVATERAKDVRFAAQSALDAWAKALESDDPEYSLLNRSDPFGSSVAGLSVSGGESSSNCGNTVPIVSKDSHVTADSLTITRSCKSFKVSFRNDCNSGTMRFRSWTLYSHLCPGERKLTGHRAFSCAICNRY